MTKNTIIQGNTQQTKYWWTSLRHSAIKKCTVYRSSYCLLKVYPHLILRISFEADPRKKSGKCCHLHHLGRHLAPAPFHPWFVSRGKLQYPSISALQGGKIFSEGSRPTPRFTPHCRQTPTKQNSSTPPANDQEFLYFLFLHPEMASNVLLLPLPAGNRKYSWFIYWLVLAEDLACLWRMLRSQVVDDKKPPS